MDRNSRAKNRKITKQQQSVTSFKNNIFILWTQLMMTVWNKLHHCAQMTIKGEMIARICCFASLKGLLALLSPHHDVSSATRFATKRFHLIHPKTLFTVIAALSKNRMLEVRSGGFRFYFFVLKLISHIKQSSWTQGFLKESHNYGLSCLTELNWIVYRKLTRLHTMRTMTPISLLYIFTILYSTSQHSK